VSLVATFEHVPGWGAALPDLTIQDVSDIEIDPDDNIYLLYRDLRAVIVCDPDGTFQRTLGQGAIGHAHGLALSRDRRLYVVDEGGSRIRVLDEQGAVVEEFGSGPTNPHGRTVDRGYPPFSRPTRLAFAPTGDFFVSDGYGNSRVHRYGAGHGLLASWGEPGSGPGKFQIPHDVYVDRDGRVLVCDRENDRIQIFTADGVLTDEWTDLHRPQGVVQDAGGTYYVSEGAWRSGHVSPLHGPVEPAPSRVSIVDRDGQVLGRLGKESISEPDGFIAAHSIALDSAGNLYVAEVSATILGRASLQDSVTCAAVKKFRRTG
jgi:sugar lactone lactonase YvrE